MKRSKPFAESPSSENLANWVKATTGFLNNLETVVLCFLHCVMRLTDAFCEFFGSARIVLRFIMAGVVAWLVWRWLQ